MIFLLQFHLFYLLVDLTCPLRFLAIVLGDSIIAISHRVVLLCVVRLSVLCLLSVSGYVLVMNNNGRATWTFSRGARIYGIGWDLG